MEEPKFIDLTYLKTARIYSEHWFKETLDDKGMAQIKTVNQVILDADNAQIHCQQQFEDSDIDVNDLPFMDIENSNLSSVQKEAFELVMTAIEAVGSTIPLVKRLLERIPDQSALWNNYGVLVLCIGDLEDAENAFQRGLECDPADLTIHYNLGSIYLAQDRFPEAEQAYQTVVDGDPTHGMAWGHLGISLSLLERYVEAEVALQRAITYLPSNIDFQLSLGKALLEIDDLSEAEAVFRQSFTTNPYHNPSWIVLRDILTEQFRFEELQNLLLKVVEEIPHSSLAWFWLAELFQDEDRAEDAVQAYKNAIDNASTFASLWKRHYASIFTQEADSGTGLSHHETVETLALTAWNRLSQLYRKLERYPEAERAMKQAHTVLVNLDKQRKEQEEVARVKEILSRPTGEWAEEVERFRRSFKRQDSD
jgi:tetratricopeptide (TPR) repeat protein